MAMSAALRTPYPLWRRATAVGALVAGTAWGAILTAGFTAHAWVSCGVVCLDDVLVTGAVSMAAGVVAIGPLAAWRG